MYVYVCVIVFENVLYALKMPLLPKADYTSYSKNLKERNYIIKSFKIGWLGALGWLRGTCSS